MAGDTDEDLAYSDWYMTLQPSAAQKRRQRLYSEEKIASSSNSGGGGGVSGLSRKNSSHDDETLQFVLTTNGEDTDCLTGLATYNIFSSALQSGKYSVRVPPEHQMIACDLTHHASMTEHLLAYLESVVPNLRFLCHYDLSLDILMEDDDNEMLFSCSQLCKHPIIALAAEEDVAQSYDVEEPTGSDDEDDNDDLDGGLEAKKSVGGGKTKKYRVNLNNLRTSSNERYKHQSGRGTLLGLDLHLVSRSLVIIRQAYFLGSNNNAADDAADLDLDEDDLPDDRFIWSDSPLDLTACVRPFEKRMEFFVGEKEESFYEVKRIFRIINRYNFSHGPGATRGAGGATGGGDGAGSNEEGMGDSDNDSLLADGEGGGTGEGKSGGGGGGGISEAEYAAKRAAKTAKLNEEYRDVRIKIVDLGNACWTHKHFTEDIQTRQYRSPEVLIGANYDTSADMWSLACIVFELLTGDLMFDPHAGKSWNREEDHLALIIELLGDFPKPLLNAGKHTTDYFNKRGELKHIHQLNYWPLRDVLREKYKFSDQEAKEISSFLLPILEVI